MRAVQKGNRWLKNLVALNEVDLFHPVVLPRKPVDIIYATCAWDCSHDGLRKGLHR